MNQPTREEFEEFKQEVKEEVRQLREQITEPMKAIRVDVASEDVVKRLDDIVQKLSDQSELLKRIDTKQGDHGKALFSHSEKISTLQKDVAALPTKEDLEALLIKYLRPGGNGHKSEKPPES
jgi:alkyl hydroperoxide reductase subunit AhpF